jgi:iron(III) transport system substrate-binding protein
MRQTVVIVLACAVLLAPGCRRRAVREVVIYTSVDQVFAEPVLRAFEERSGIRVRAVFDTEETKSTGVVNRLIAEATHPQADVFWSGDPVRPFLLIRRGLVAPYVSPEAAAIPPGFRGVDGLWTGTAARARVLLVNRDRVGTGERPRTIRALADPQWRGKGAIANPLFGTTTMHVAALFTIWGDSEATTFLQAIKDNHTRIASSNGEVKRLVVAGEVAFGLTDTDDAHDAVVSGAPVEVVYPDAESAGTLVMPTSVVLLKGGPNADSARALVDYLLSAEAERRMAENGAHMPLRSDVAVPAGVRRIAEVRAMAVDYAQVADTMETIQPTLRAWAGL